MSTWPDTDPLFWDECPTCGGDGSVTCDCDDRGCSRCLGGERTCSACQGSGSVFVGDDLDDDGDLDDPEIPEGDGR